MEYHQLGQDGPRVSAACLGTMTWGEQNNEGEAHRQLDYAVDHGINIIDTAEMYPVPAKPETQGSTETILGTWLSRGNRKRVLVASKVVGQSGMRWIRRGGGLDSGQIRKAVEASLSRLQTDVIDLYQIHWPDRYTPRFGERHFQQNRFRDGAPILETMSVMAELIREGKIRWYGLSNETPYGVSRYVTLAEQQGLPKPVSIQNAYNLLNRSFEIALAETCFHEQIGLLAYSPLAFGHLTGKYLNGAMPAGARIALYPDYAKRYRDKPNTEAAVRAYAQAAGAHGLTRMALQFIKSRPFCKSVIIGATNMTQLVENIEAFNGEIPPHLVSAIESISETYPDPNP